MKYLNLIVIYLGYLSCASFSLEFMLKDVYSKNNQIYSSVQNWKKVEILSKKPQKNIKVYGKIIIRKFDSVGNSKKFRNYIQKKIYQKGLDGVFFTKITHEKIDSFNLERTTEDRQKISYHTKKKDENDYWFCL